MLHNYDDTYNDLDFESLISGHNSIPQESNSWPYKNLHSATSSENRKTELTEEERKRINSIQWKNGSEEEDLDDTEELTEKECVAKAEMFKRFKGYENCEPFTEEEKRK